MTSPPSPPGERKPQRNKANVLGGGSKSLSPPPAFGKGDHPFSQVGDYALPGRHPILIDLDQVELLRARGWTWDKIALEVTPPDRGSPYTSGRLARVYKEARRARIPI